MLAFLRKARNGAPVARGVQLHAGAARQLPRRRAARRAAGASASTATPRSTAAAARATSAASSASPVAAHGRFQSLNLRLPPLGLLVLEPAEAAHEPASCRRLMPAARPSRRCTEAGRSAIRCAARSQPALGDRARSRVVIEHVTPCVDGGRFAVKRVVGDAVECRGRLLRRRPRRGRLRRAVAAWRRRRVARGADGAARQRPLARRVRRRSRSGAGTTRCAPGSIPSCRGGTTSSAASMPTTSASRRAVGAELIDAGRAARAQRRRRQAAAGLGGELLDALAAEPAADALKAIGAGRGAQRARRAPPRSAACLHQRAELPLVVERERARFSRLVRALPALGVARRPAGTARSPTARRGCPTSRRWASTCSTCRRSIRSAASRRKGRNNALDAAPDDVGSPWAIGARGRAQGDPPASSARSRTSAAWCAAAGEHGLEIALDIAFQCAPDHPYVARAPGVVPRAARRHDPVRREPAEEVPGHLSVRLRDRRLAGAVGRAERACSSSGSTQGVRIFRVDNPHTKPFAFWEWADRRGQARAPRGDLPRRGVHPAEGDAPPGQARLHASRTPTSPGATPSTS